MGIKRLRASVFLLALVAAWCLAGGAASAETKAEDLIVGGVLNLDSVTQAQWPIVFSTTTPKDVTIRGSAQNTADDTSGTIRIKGNDTDFGTVFNITLDGITLRSRASAIQIVDGAVVNLTIKGTNTLKTKSFTSNGGDGMLHVGATEQTQNGQGSTSARCELNIIGFDKDDRSKNILIIDESEQSSPGIDAIRLRGLKVAGGGYEAVADLISHKMTIKHITLDVKDVLPNNRAICCDTTEETMFDDCHMTVLGGVPIISGIMGYPNSVFGDLHFKNCALNLTSTINDAYPSTLATTLGSSPARYGAITVHPGHKVIFCDSESNSAFIHGSKTANGSTFNNGITAGEVIISGGAIRVDSLGSSQPNIYGILANKIDVVKQDPHHPDADNPSQVILYVDKTGPNADIHIEEGMNAIVAGTSNLTDKTTPEYQDWSARTPASGTGSYTIGNVVGDFELFDTRIDKTVLGEPDYTIHDGEVIIVDKGNTLTINDMSKFVIEKDGHLVLIGDGNINDGVIEVHGRTDDELKQMIRDEFGGKLGGSGSILNADTGTMLTNSGTSWDELVDNTDTAERAKINNDGTPNLVVFGKNDTTGKDALVAVNPKTKDDPYLVPLNERLDLKVVITEPGNDKKVQNTSSHNGKFMSAAVWPLDASGNPLGPVDTASRVPTINPLPVTKISGGMTQFTLSEDDIRKLREYAKQNGLQEFVIWVYEVDTINDTDYNGTGLKMPFVFKVDSPEHTFSTSVPADQKSNIVQDANTLVRVNVTQQAGTPLAEYRALNPTRSDVISLTENEDVLPEVYIARNAGDTKLNTNSGFEGKTVLASIRPYDGLSMSQYKGLGDFIESDGPKPITDGYAGFQFDYKSLHRWARRLRLREFVVYLRDVETNGGLIESEFVVRLGEADVDTHGTHCAGCDTGVGIALAAGALAVVAMRRRKES